MFIDGIFYSDLRSERSVDYAPELIKHLKDTNNSEITVREEKSRSMGIRLFDIERIPFGERCVYIHQGDIEHGMYFTGARKFNLACDCPFQESYPVLVFLRKCFKSLRDIAALVSRIRRRLLCTDPTGFRMIRDISVTCVSCYRVPEATTV